MTFPVVFHAGPFSITAHLVFESLAYAIGFRLYLHNRRRAGDILSTSDRFTVIAAALLGAALGSKALYWFEDPALTARHSFDIPYLLAGKTIVGGLLGGTLFVEWVKKRSRITRRTGDLFVLPMIVAIAIGRIGCFLAGLPDHTYGIATALPWGVDFGDRIQRHPTQLYEIAFLIALGFWVVRFSRQTHREGDLYRLFLTSYLAFRFWIEFLKPGVPIAGLTAIQWACLAGILAYWRDFPFLFAPGRTRTTWVTGSARISSTTPPSRSVRSVIAVAMPRLFFKKIAFIS